jgi:branched-chain amino acid transport system ATP-binding protein
MLELENIRASYGDLRVLSSVSLTARSGHVTAVLGRNGAGKTSLLNVAMGLPPSVNSGAVRLDGVDMTREQPYVRVAAGLGLVQEHKRIFRERTVEENLLLGGYVCRRKLRPSRRELGPRIERAYDRFPELLARRQVRAGRLSGGQQQMLAIAQALMPDPKVLLLDEPSAGLSPALSQRVFNLIGALRSEGLALVVVEQAIELALSIADEVVVLETGQVAALGPASEFEDRALIEEIYLRGSVQSRLSTTDSAERGGSSGEGSPPV